MRSLLILIIWAIWLGVMKSVCDISPDAIAISTSIIIAAEYVEAALGKE